MALDARTGDLLWETPIDSGHVTTTPAYYEGNLYFGTNWGDGTFYAINASDGSVVWTQPLGGDEYTASTLAVDGVVYVPLIYDRMVAMYASNGSVIWDRVVPMDLHTSPAWEDGVIYTAHIKTAAVNASNGDVIWQVPGSSIRSGLVVEGDRVCGHGHGYVRCMYKTNGTNIWQTNLGTNFWNAMESTPAVMGNSLFVGTQDGRAYALRLDDGGELWNVTIGAYSDDSILASPVAAPNGVVYFMDTDIHALNATTGAEVWRISDFCPGITRASPLLVNGVLYAHCSAGRIFAIGDLVPPEVTDVSLNDKPSIWAKPGTLVHVTAVVNDTGEGDVVSANVSVVPSGGAWDMNAVDGALDSPTEQVDFLLSTTGMIDGGYGLEFGVCDHRGNCHTVDKGELLHIDGSPPTIAADPLDSAPVLAPFVLSGSATDAGSVAEVQVEYMEPGGQWSQGLATLDGDSYSFEVPAQHSLGAFQYHLLATDEVGNAGRHPPSGELEVQIVDESPPEVLNLSADPSSLLVGEECTVTWEATDNFALQEVVLEVIDPTLHLVLKKTEGDGGPHQTRFAPQAPGEYVIRVTATDMGGNSVFETVRIRTNESAVDRGGADALSFWPWLAALLIVLIAVILLVLLRRKSRSSDRKSERQSK